MKAVVELANGTWYAMTPEDARMFQAILQRSHEVQKIDTCYTVLGRPTADVTIIPGRRIEGLYEAHLVVATA